ncbi:hypothetical protein [Stratiformator vulcanicus]|uniref:Uncharacterized protein n=1 Tax=Stratiformator vulcanicus TaxID=2527980 RepID=A0A517QWN7_9PLAN|nr:hypothetical protein [Stratiformator vulcanicus]QDT36007.1 hypothetical protein Pan189_03620 [Stratiformator vulcanicus]
MSIQTDTIIEPAFFASDSVFGVIRRGYPEEYVLAKWLSASSDSAPGHIVSLPDAVNLTEAGSAARYQIAAASESPNLAFTVSGELAAFQDEFEEDQVEWDIVEERSKVSFNIGPLEFVDDSQEAALIIGDDDSVGKVDEYDWPKLLSDATLDNDVERSDWLARQAPLYGLCQGKHLRIGPIQLPADTSFDAVRQRLASSIFVVVVNLTSAEGDEG